MMRRGRGISILIQFSSGIQNPGKEKKIKKQVTTQKKTRRNKKKLHFVQRYFVNSVDAYEKRTALHYAAWEGNDDVAQKLLENGADILQRDSGERTAIHYACYRGHQHVVRMMIGVAVYRLLNWLL